MIEEVKFAYPGIYPGNIEFSKTRAEADNEIMGGVAYVGTNYPIKLTLDNFVKFYWRMRRITATASMTQELEGWSSTASLVNSELILVDTGGLALTQTTSLETLESRTCPGTFLIKYITQQDSSGPVASTSFKLNNYMWPLQFTYPVIAELRSGPASDLNNYDFYPRIGVFQIGCGYNFSFATVAATAGSTIGTDVTVNVNMDGAIVSEITFHGFTYDGAATETQSFSDWNIELWPTLELEFAAPVS